MKIRMSSVVVTSLLVCVGFLQNTKAVNPPPDGGYPGKNTAEGQDALFSLTTGNSNTATGFQVLKANTSGDRNTADGAFALFSNQVGSENTATGYAALFFNRGSLNTATGIGALHDNATGSNNTACGERALYNNFSRSGTLPPAVGRLVTIQRATTTQPTVFRRSLTIRQAAPTSDWVEVQAVASPRLTTLFASGLRAPM